MVRQKVVPSGQTSKEIVIFHKIVIVVKTSVFQKLKYFKNV